MGKVFVGLLLMYFFGSSYCVPIKFADNVTCGYSACPSTDPNKINVHIVPHSHDDVGWLKTVDQYYFEDVQNVISSVVTALKQNSKRRFVQVETAFFKKWWEQQNEERRQEVRQLVNEGRLEIINAAWSMNDEGAVHYQSTIDQFTLGLRYIEDALGVCGRPRIGWQIDPFGHSREQASIFAQLGFDGIFFARLDYRDRNQRLQDKTSDLLWTGSVNLGPESNIFTSVLFNHYSAPAGFCFDHVCNDAPIVEDKESIEYNLDARVNEFTNYLENQAQYYPTNNLLVVMGDDFRYQAAITSYLNTDRLIRGMENFNPTVMGKEINIFYSTPSCYVKAVNDYVKANNIELNVKADDFFPYAGDPASVFSGYFSSRPASKRYERQANNLLQVARQVTSLAGYPFGKNRLLEEAIGVMQHHDAITGTERQFVDNDYRRFMTAGINNAIATSSNALSELVGANEDLEFKSCMLSNASICLESKMDEFNLLLYNPLARSVSHYIQIPVDSESWKIIGPEGQAGKIQHQIINSVKNFDYVSSDATSKILIFRADLPGVGYNVYNFQRQNEIGKIKEKVKESTEIGFEDTYIQLNEETGLLESITMNGVTMQVKQELMYYQNREGSNAYIFRTDDNQRDALHLSETVENIINVDGSLVKEVKQVFREWATQTIRIYEDEDFIEFDWVIGPIEVNLDEHLGKEVIARFTTDLETDGKFYTDSNGRELIERKKNYRPTFTYTDEEPQAGNYYPVANRILIKDDTNELAIITDRAEGGSSLNDGELEIMLHRVCLTSDATGELLNEQEFGQGLVARGSFYVTLGNSKKGNGQKSMAAIERGIALRKHLTPWAFFTPNNVPIKSQSFIIFELPENIHLLTFDKWNDTENTYLIRLEHIMEKNDDGNLSQEVTVNIENLFTSFRITSLKETTLGGVQPLDETSRLSWPQVSSGEDQFPSLSIKNRLLRDVDDMNVTLAAMQIRTFIASVEKL